MVNMDYDEYDDVSESDDSSMDQLSATSADGCGVYSDDSDWTFGNKCLWGIKIQNVV